MSFDSPKRSVRNRYKSQKYGEFISTSPTKRKSVAVPLSSDEDDGSISEGPVLKSSVLFSSDDVEGQDMFKFKSRHTKYDLHNKVKAAISNTPSVESPLRTPRRSIHRGSFASPLHTASEATPKHVKDVIKKRIIHEVGSDSDESDFSGGSSSDFRPDDESHSESESSSEEENAAPPADDSKGASRAQPAGRGARGARRADHEYVVTPDDYFMMHSTKKITTSDRTLARLKHMNIADDTHAHAHAHTHVSEEHRARVGELTHSYRQLFDRWMFALSEHFNLMLYGVGSKRAIIQQFQRDKLKHFPCVVVNGFFPSLTINHIVESIVVELLGNSSVPTNVGDAVQLIGGQLRESGTDLFVIIHNIDGTTLRTAKAQARLASLSLIPNVHVIASIDHINAPLLWDHSKLSKFRWTWWDATSFLPYVEETCNENSLLTSRSGALQLASLRSVYVSLTTNSKGILGVIIRYQLDGHTDKHYQGLPFKQLYSLCREQFLVSSDVALRAQLTEFTDHRIVRVRRTADGGENLTVPIDNVLLRQFLEEQAEM